MWFCCRDFGLLISYPLDFLWLCMMQVVILLRCPVGGRDALVTTSCWRWPIWLPGIRVETWEGFNHVACIIIASAMAGIGLITDSLSVVEGMQWCGLLKIIPRTFRGEVGKIIPNNRTGITKILRKQCQMMACWIPFSVWTAKSILWVLWWRVSSLNVLTCRLAICRLM